MFNKKHRCRFCATKFKTACERYRHEEAMPYCFPRGVCFQKHHCDLYSSCSEDTLFRCSTCGHGYRKQTDRDEHENKRTCKMLYVQICCHCHAKTLSRRNPVPFCCVACLGSDHHCYHSSCGCRFHTQADVDEQKELLMHIATALKVLGEREKEFQLRSLYCRCCVRYSDTT